MNSCKINLYISLRLDFFVLFSFSFYFASLAGKIISGSLRLCGEKPFARSVAKKMTPPKSLLIVIAMLALLSACQKAAAPVSISNRPVSINGVPQPGTPTKPIEQMSWTLADGTEHRLGDLKDKVVILDFWATYCPPCREEIPHLNSLQAKYGADRLHIVGLNVGGDEDKPKIPAFVRDMKMSYPVAHPEGQLVSFIFGNDDSIPQTAVFDRSGQLVLKIAGYSPQIRDELDRAVESAISE